MKIIPFLAAVLFISCPTSAADKGENGPPATNVLSASISALESEKLETLHTSRSPEGVSCSMREAKFLGTAKAFLGGAKHFCKFVFLLEGEPNPKVTPDRFGLHGHVAVFSEDFKLEGILHLDDGRDAGLFGSVFLLGVASIDLSTHDGLADFQKRLDLTFPAAAKSDVK